MTAHAVRRFLARASFYFAPGEQFFLVDVRPHRQVRPDGGIEWAGARRRPPANTRCPQPGGQPAHDRPAGWRFRQRRLRWFLDDVLITE